MKKIILRDQQLNQLVASVTAQRLDGKSFPDGVISGPEIVKFSSHNQVNKFVLFQIYQDWNAMMQKMQHPFFDYNVPEVQESLNDFLNVLSRNIQVPLADFKKLLQQAIYNSLKLILNPEDALSNFFFMNAPSIPLKLFKKHSVYFKDFDFAVRSLQRFFEKNNMAKVERALFLEKFSKVIDIFEKKNNTEIYTYQKTLFKNLTGKDLDLLAEEAKEAPVKVIDPPAEKHNVPSALANKPEIPTGTNEAIPDWIKREKDRRNRAMENNKIESPVTNTSTTSKEQPPVKDTPDSEKQPPSKEQPAKKPTLADKLAKENSSTGQPNDKTVSSAHQENKSEKRSVNDVFSEREKEKPHRKVASLLSPKGKNKTTPVKENPQTPEEESSPQEGQKSTINLFAQAKKAEAKFKDKKTVAEALGTEDNKGKSSLNQSLGKKMIRTEQIPVHKQFQFVQKVFGGSSVKFKVVLDKINKTVSREEAESVLNRYVFNDPSVNRNDKACKEFVGLVNERFEE